MIEINLRDVNIKCKKLRKEGIITGTLKRINGEIIPISLKGNKIDSYILNNGFNEDLNVVLNGEEIVTKIYRVQKNLLIHNIDNIDIWEKKC